MSDWREVVGATREEALEAAVRILGIAEADMEVAELPGEGGGVKLVVRAATTTTPEAPALAKEQPDEEEVPVVTGESEESGPGPELLAEQQNTALDFLEEILDAFDLEGELVAEYRDGILALDVQGDDLGSLIGRRGMTLAALTEVARTVVQRRTSAPARMALDVAGYRAKRKVALQRYARQLAEEVARSGVEKALEPMTPADRKIVHDAVNEIDSVRTYSEGVEPKRNVVISPS